MLSRSDESICGRIVRGVLPVLAALVAGVLPLLLERSGTGSSAVTGADIVLSVSLDEREPVQYSAVTVSAQVQDQQQRPVIGATVTATAHYRTTTTVRSAVTDHTGAAELRFRISAATPGYPVRVLVVAVLDGQTNSAEVSFTPRRRFASGDAADSRVLDLVCSHGPTEQNRARRFLSTSKVQRMERGCISEILVDHRKGEDQMGIMGAARDAKATLKYSMRIAWIEDNYPVRGTADLAQARQMLTHRQWQVLERHLDRMEQSYPRLRWWQKILRGLSESR